MYWNTADFLKNRGTKKTKITMPDKATITLDGIPAKYTSKALAKLAEKTFKATVSLPFEIVARQKVKPRDVLTGKEVAEFIADICAAGTDGIATADNDTTQDSEAA